MLNAGTQIDKVRAIYQATRHLQLAEIPPIDFTDRISLLTVAAGLRNAAVFEGDGLEIALVKDVVINHGLFTSTTNAVWARRDPHRCAASRASRPLASGSGVESIPPGLSGYSVARIGSASRMPS